MLNKKIIIWLTTMLVSIFLIGCISTDPNEDIVITRPENVLPEVMSGDYTNIPLEERPVQVVKPDEISGQLGNTVRKVMPDATVLVFTQRKFLKEEFRSTTDLSQAIFLVVGHMDPETGEVTPDTQGIISTLTGVVGAFAPEFAPLVGLIGLLPWFARKRSRQHLATAVKAAVPYDGTINIAASASAIAKAFGWSHSTENPEELEAIAKRKRVAEAAKNGGLDTLAKSIEPKPQSDVIQPS